MKKFAIALIAILVLGAGGLWGYLHYIANTYVANVTCNDVLSGIADLLTDADVSNDNIRSGNLAVAGSTVLGYANIRTLAPNPASTLAAAPVPFTAFNQLASMCAAKPHFKVWSFVSTNLDLAQTNPSAANDALDAELVGVKIEQFPAGEVFAKILSAAPKTDAQASSNATPVVSPTTQSAE